MLCVDVSFQTDPSDRLPDRDGLRPGCEGHTDNSGDRSGDDLVGNNRLHMRDNV